MQELRARLAEEHGRAVAWAESQAREWSRAAKMATQEELAEARAALADAAGRAEDLAGQVASLEKKLAERDEALSRIRELRGQEAELRESELLRECPFREMKRALLVPGELRTASLYGAVWQSPCGKFHEVYTGVGRLGPCDGPDYGGFCARPGPDLPTWVQQALPTRCLELFDGGWRIVRSHRIDDAVLGCETVMSFRLAEAEPARRARTWAPLRLPGWRSSGGVTAVGGDVSHDAACFLHAHDEGHCLRDSVALRLRLPARVAALQHEVAALQHALQHEAELVPQEAKAAPVEPARCYARRSGANEAEESTGTNGTKGKEGPK